MNSKLNKNIYQTPSRGQKSFTEEQYQATRSIRTNDPNNQFTKNPKEENVENNSDYQKQIMKMFGNNDSKNNFSQATPPHKTIPMTIESANLNSSENARSKKEIARKQQKIHQQFLNTELDRRKEVRRQQWLNKNKDNNSQMNDGFNPNFYQNPYFNPNFPQMNPGFNQGVQQNNPEPVQKPELVQPVAPQMNENKAEIYSTDSHQHAISGTLNKETEKNIQDIVHQTLNKDHKQAATSNAVPQSNDWMKNIVKKISQDWCKTNSTTNGNNVEINEQGFANNQQQVEQINNPIQQFVQQVEPVQEVIQQAEPQFQPVFAPQQVEQTQELVQVQEAAPQFQPVFIQQPEVIQQPDHQFQPVFAPEQPESEFDNFDQLVSEGFQPYYAPDELFSEPVQFVQQEEPVQEAAPQFQPVFIQQPEPQFQPVFIQQAEPIQELVQVQEASPQFQPVFIQQPEQILPQIQVVGPTIETPQSNSLMMSNKVLTRNSRFDNVEMFEAGLLSSDSKLKLENLNSLLILGGISYEDYFKIKNEIFIKEIKNF